MIQIIVMSKRHDDYFTIGDSKMNNEKINDGCDVSRNTNNNSGELKMENLVETNVGSQVSVNTKLSSVFENLQIYCNPKNLSECLVYTTSNTIEDIHQGFDFKIGIQEYAFVDFVKLAFKTTNTQFVNDNFKLFFLPHCVYEKYPNSQKYHIGKGAIKVIYSSSLPYDIEVIVKLIFSEHGGIISKINIPRIPNSSRILKIEQFPENFYFTYKSIKR